MSHTRTIAIVSLIAVAHLTGCLAALRKHNQDRRTTKRAERIEAACQARDGGALKELLRIESDPENHARARGCYLDIELSALLATDCRGFAGALTDVVTYQGETKITTRNPMLEFTRFTDHMTTSEERQLRLVVAEKAFTCGYGDVVFGNPGRFLPARARTAWVDTYEDLAAKGHDVYGLFLGTVKRPDHAPLDTPSAVRWLMQTQASARCAELERASRAEPRLRADLVIFFAHNRCRAQTHTVAGELLASRSAALRARACSTLRDVGDHSYAAKMRLLARTDPARQLEQEDIDLWTYTFVTYPVREACQQALNELTLGQ